MINYNNIKQWQWIPHKLFLSIKVYKFINWILIYTPIYIRHGSRVKIWEGPIIILQRKYNYNIGNYTIHI